MAEPIKANWGAISAAYTLGSTAEQLEEQYGVKADTIRQRAKRQGWSRKALKQAEATQLAESGEKPVSSQARAIAEASLVVMNAFNAQKQEFLSRGATVAVTGMKKVQEALENESNIFNVASLGEIGESFTRIAKPVFSLGDSSVNINLATQVNVLSDLPPDTLEWDAKASD